MTCTPVGVVSSPLLPEAIGPRTFKNAPQDHSPERSSQPDVLDRPRTTNWSRGWRWLLTFALTRRQIRAPRSLAWAAAFGRIVVRRTTRTGLRCRFWVSGGAFRQLVGIRRCGVALFQ